MGLAISHFLKQKTGRGFIPSRGQDSVERGRSLIPNIPKVSKLALVEKFDFLRHFWLFSSDKNRFKKKTSKIDFHTAGFKEKNSGANPFPRDRPKYNFFIVLWKIEKILFANKYFYFHHFQESTRHEIHPAERNLAWLLNRDVLLPSPPLAISLRYAPYRRQKIQNSDTVEGEIPRYYLWSL